MITKNVKTMKEVIGEHIGRVEALQNENPTNERAAYIRALKYSLSVIKANE